MSGAVDDDDDMKITINDDDDDDDDDAVCSEMTQLQPSGKRSHATGTRDTSGFNLLAVVIFSAITEDTASTANSAKSAP